MQSKDIPIVLLGGGAVGKSCITIQYIQGHFVEGYDITIEDVYRKPIELDGVPSILTIVDTAGQDAFATMREQYMKSGRGFVLVYSITDNESFQTLKKIYAQLRRTKPAGEPMSCIVVGNKLDLNSQRAVTKEEGQMFARQANSPFVEISAKDRLNVEDVFTTLIRNIRNERALGSTPAAATASAQQPNSPPEKAKERATSNGPDTGKRRAEEEPERPKPRRKKGWRCGIL